LKKRNVLKFDDVTFSYGKGDTILQNFSLQVEEQEFVSIVGPSGCGKSTLFRLLTGLEEVTAGVIHTDGRIGYMPQKDLLLPWRTIVANAAIPLEIQGVPKKEAEARVMELLEEFGLKGYEHKYPSDLSGGMRQRVSFLRTFLTGADILLLDEPFSALDAFTKRKMQEWLLEQYHKWNKTILFITHDVEEALFLSTKLWVLSEKPIRESKELIVPLSYPRQRTDLHLPEILQMEEQLMKELGEMVKL
jgi:putative hydroxymethylpyrimidine transport system ATP-binding protein